MLSTCVRLGAARVHFEFMLALATSLVTSCLALVLAFALQKTIATPDTSFLLQDGSVWLQFVPYCRLLILALPIIWATLFATSLVAAEFERGTVVFAWSIARDRSRWLRDNVVVGLALLSACSLPLLLVSIILSDILGPQADAASLPAPLDPAALMLLARGVLAFAVVVTTGIAVGRVLHALLAGFALACVLIGGLEGILNNVLRGRLAAIGDPLLTVVPTGLFLLVAVAPIAIASALLSNRRST